jgi:hypothetical protein
VRTLFPSLMARYAVHTAHRSPPRPASQNLMERCGCSLPPVALTVGRRPYAPSVKDMAPPPPNPGCSRAVLHPQPPPQPQLQPASEERAPPCLPATHPLLWADWSRGPPRRAWIEWQRSHLVTVNAPAVPSPPSTPSLLSRAERAHWRMTWQQRLARNERRATAPPVEITVYGLPTGFAQALGLRVA